jgi:hypothetical protein
MWKNTRGLTLSLAAICFVGVVQADSIPFEHVQTTFDGMRAGSVPVDNALSAAQDFLKEHPDDPVVTAYLGSIKGRMAKDSWLPWRKLRYVNEALDLLDKAVASMGQAKSWDGRDPKIVILMVSGSTNAQIPKTFGRKPFAERDFQAILAAPNFDRLKTHDKATAYAWMAVLTADRSPPQAEHYLKQGREMDASVAEQIWEKR